ncbi:11431_t:CDS:2, partial [Ambispora gerdemannii]
LSGYSGEGTLLGGYTIGGFYTVIYELTKPAVKKRGDPDKPAV